MKYWRDAFADGLLEIYRKACRVQRDGRMKTAGRAEMVKVLDDEAERTIRPSAEARKTGRTNKTLYGARRQSIIVSVLESLRVYLKSYKLADVLAEIERWKKAGRSCFAKLLRKLKLPPPGVSILDKLLPATATTGPPESPIPDG